MKKIVWTAIIIIVAGTCLWISFSYLIWFLPPQPKTHEIALADLDSDGDLDAFLANGRNESSEPNTVLLNDGKGNFQDSGQKLGNRESRAVVLQDFDNDGDIDALVGDIWMGAYFWNAGDGNFEHSQETYFPDTDGYSMGLWRFKAADLNSDNLTDLFLISCCGGGVSNGPDDFQPIYTHNTVWLSNGQGLPRYTGQELGLGSSEAVDLGDIDGDGDLDAFVTHSTHDDETGETVAYDPNEVWLNDGKGVFTDSGQRLGNQRSYSIALGDLDSDGDLDAFVGNLGADEVWLNDGNALFIDSGQTLGNSLTRYLYLADLDSDGDLDAFVGSDRVGRIWINDGHGNFKVTSQRFHYGWDYAVTVGDVDGNGTVDVIAGKLATAKVWYNNGTGRMQTNK